MLLLTKAVLNANDPFMTFQIIGDPVARLAELAGTAELETLGLLD